MSSTPHPSLWSLPGVGFASAAGLELAATAVCRQLPAPAGGLVLVAIGVGGSLLLPWRYAVALAVTTWAFLTGFVVHDGGQLTFTPGDLRHAAALVGAAALVSRVATLARHRRRVRAAGARPDGFATAGDTGKRRQAERPGGLARHGGGRARPHPQVSGAARPRT
ncbi:MAG: hypothetical protein JWO76_2638 [Nocardioides sp.]|nr:hypothetical protein [Nocardioides sp.]